MVGALVLSGGQDRDGWNDLAAAAFGMMAAVAAAAIVWVLLLVRGARRVFPAGRRAVPVVLTIGSGAAASVGAGLLVAVLGDGDGIPGALLLLPVPAVLLSAAVFPWWQRRLDRAAAAVPGGCTNRTFG